MQLYHGSDTAIGHPDVSFNKGFSDLGQGFYLTDDRDVALARARSRARATGSAEGIVSVFDFDECAVRWAVWDEQGPAHPVGLSHGEKAPFGLSFAMNQAGIIAWIEYIKACRAGQTSVPSLGEPAVVRAWIATEEVEMACSGFVSAEDLAEFIDPADLVVQYCFRDQGTLDRLLTFSHACAS